MPNSWLLDTIYNGGLPQTHYFDGRLLNADAFQTDQNATQTRLGWLGQAAGAGVVDGLVVSKIQTSATKLGITQGVGVNYNGHLMRLPADISLELGKGTTSTTPTTAASLKKPGTFTSSSNQQQLLQQAQQQQVQQQLQQSQQQLVQLQWQLQQSQQQLQLLQPPQQQAQQTQQAPQQTQQLQQLQQQLNLLQQQLQQVSGQLLQWQPQQQLQQVQQQLQQAQQQLQQVQQELKQPGEQVQPPQELQQLQQQLVQLQQLVQQFQQQLLQLLQQQSQGAQQPQTGGSNGTGALPEGVYLLTMFPAITHFEGLAPMRSTVSGVSSGIGNVPGCGSKWEVEGVQFKVIRLDSSTMDNLFKGVEGIAAGDKGGRLRNLLAHWCYGTLIVRDFGIHPFDPGNDFYDPLDPRTPYIADLTADDLPLAAFRWDGSQVTFVDLWAARRRITHHNALFGTNSLQGMGTWKALIDDRRAAGNQARFRQFQDQLDTIVAAGNRPGSGVSPLQVKAGDYFSFLPPVGFLPVSQKSLQALVCGPGEQRPGRDGGTEQESEHWQYGFQFNMSEDVIRMLGLFTGVTIGAVLDTMFPGVTALGVAGAGLSYIARGIGSIFHMGGTAVAAAAQNSTAIDALTQRVGALEAAQQGTPGLVVVEQAGGGAQGQGQPPDRELHIGASIEGGSTKEEKRTGPKELAERFHERVCVTVEKPRINKDGTPRSETEGFDLATFFEGYVLRTSLIGKDRVDSLMNESWYEDAIDLRPGRHPNTPVDQTGDPTVPVEKGLHRMPFIIDIYLVAENLVDTAEPLYIIFHKSLHPVELIRVDQPSAQSTSNQSQGASGVSVPAAQ